MVEISTANTIEAYKSLEMRPESTLNTAITNANSPSAAMENPVMRQSLKCASVNFCDAMSKASKERSDEKGGCERSEKRVR